MSFLAGLISILALSAAGPANHDAPGVAAQPCATVQKTAMAGQYPRKHLNPRYKASSPYTPSDPLDWSSEGRGDNFGKDLLDGGRAPLDVHPVRDDGASFRFLASANDLTPGAVRALPQRC